MTLQGTVVNGAIVIDGTHALPEGARVWIELATADDSDDFTPPPPTETYEEHLAALRASIEETKAGVGGVEARQFLKELAIKHKMPLLPGE